VVFTFCMPGFGYAHCDNPSDPKEKRMKVICNVSDLEMQQSIELYESRLPKIWEEQWPISDLLIFVPCPLLALSRHS